MPVKLAQLKGFKKPSLKTGKKSSLSKPSYSAASLIFAEFINELKKQLPIPYFGENELQFAKHVGRRWKFDVAWVESGDGKRLIKLAVEIEGGGYIKRADGSLGGRHHSAEGFRKDIEKYNKAVELGWVLLRYEYSDLGATRLQNTIKQIVDVYNLRYDLNLKQ